MLARLGEFVVRRRRLVLVSAALAFAISGALGGGVADQLSSGGFNDPDAESSRIEPILETQFQSGTPNIILLVTARSGNIDDPDVAAAGRALAGQLAAESHEGLAMTQVLSYWDLPPGNPLRSEAGDRALVLARFPDEDDNLLVDFSGDVSDRYTLDDPSQPISVRVGGFGPLFSEVNETIESDLLRAEIIALPITLFLLLLVFGSVVSATLPILVGVLSIVGTFLVLLVVNSFTEVSIFALNLTTAMGLGLAIDYSLFIVSRYREELHRGFDPHNAVLRTVQTAGRTVLFSSLTVAASMSALLVFDIAFLRSFAYAGCAVAVLAGLYATVVLPAVLAALGHRVNALTIRKRAIVPSEEGFWHRMASFVMRRPVGITAAVLLVLAVLGSPFFGIRLGVPDDRVLPDSKETRQVSDILRAEFSSRESGALSVVATDVAAPAARADDVAAYAQRLATIDGVTRVDSESGIYCGTAGAVGGFPCEPGTALPLPPEQMGALALRFNRPDATFLSVVPDVEPISDEGERLVRDIRDADAPFDVLVGGPSAELVDANESLGNDLPLALGIIAVITSVLLFLMFGSIVIPAKAFVLNVISLSATFGAMVWVFQDGHFADVLNFTATGSLAASTLVVMFCVAFGLSMDFEVFLLSRVKEQHDRGADNVTSVAVGLEQTGRIVTAAAVLISVVFIAFAITGEVSFMKLFGVGLTVAVLLDAFVIRGTLVPAFMRLAGNANWWAPTFLRRLYERVGFSEHVDLDGEPAAALPASAPVEKAAEDEEAPRRREPLRAAGR